MSKVYFMAISLSPHSDVDMENLLVTQMSRLSERTVHIFDFRSALFCGTVSERCHVHQ